MNEMIERVAKAIAKVIIDAGPPYVTDFETYFARTGNIFRQAADAATRNLKGPPHV